MHYFNIEGFHTPIIQLEIDGGSLTTSNRVTTNKQITSDNRLSVHRTNMRVPNIGTSHDVSTATKSNRVIVEQSINEVSLRTLTYTLESKIIYSWKTSDGELVILTKRGFVYKVDRRGNISHFQMMDEGSEVRVLYALYDPLDTETFGGGKNLLVVNKKNTSYLLRLDQSTLQALNPRKISENIEHTKIAILKHNTPYLRLLPDIYQEIKTDHFWLVVRNRGHLATLNRFTNQSIAYVESLEDLRTLANTPPVDILLVQEKLIRHLKVSTESINGSIPNKQLKGTRIGIVTYNRVSDIIGKLRYFKDTEIIDGFTGNIYNYKGVD